MADLHCFISSAGTTNLQIATVDCDGWSPTVTKPTWVTATTSATDVKISVATKTDSGNREGTITISYTAGGQSCSKTCDITQRGGESKVYTKTLYINNASSYITDFADITLTINSTPVEMVTVHNDLSGVPAGTVSQGITYTAHTIGNSVQCVAVVKNDKHTGGEIIVLPCNYAACDPGEDDSVTFKYDDTM